MHATLKRAGVNKPLPKLRSLLVFAGFAGEEHLQRQRKSKECL